MRRGSRKWWVGPWLVWVVGSGCNRSARDDSARASGTALERSSAQATAAQPALGSARPPPSTPVLTTRFPAAARVVALGDVHGDLQAMRKALQLAAVVDASGQWVGGSTVLVQTGDLLDRGSDEQAIVDLLERLQSDARAQGGSVHVLNGNHELMNAALDFRYVTAGGFVDFSDAPGVDVSDQRLLRLPAEQRARASALLPGGAYARKLAAHPVAILVGDTVFCHGGVLPKYASELERINQSVATWLAGGSGAGMATLQAEDGPVWSRHYSDDPDASDCALLDQSLKLLGAARMVVGHTVQPEIRPACDGKVWRIDVGMSAHYAGSPQVLELTAAGPKVLR